MSAINRPTARWSSSSKSTSSINLSTPSMIPRKKVYRPLMNQQHNFTQRMAKTRHDIEQLFKLYYSTNIKFDTFQKQIVTGTRIPSAQTPTLTHNNFLHSSSNVFQSKHCVSREEEEHPSDIDEQHIVNNELKQLPIKRTVEVRLDNNPTMIYSTSPLPDGTPIPSNCDLNLSLSNRESDYSDALLMNSITLINDISTDFHEQSQLKKSKSVGGQHSLTKLPPITLFNNGKDVLNLSHSSFSTVNSLQPPTRPHIVTGTAVTVRERSPTKSASFKPRAKSCVQQTNLKTSAVSIQYDQSEFPMCLGARVVSIPSKCSRYVLLTFPQVPNRYNAPTSVERLLLPERFPTLFQNIVQNQNTK